MLLLPRKKEQKGTDSTRSTRLLRQFRTAFDPVIDCYNLSFRAPLEVFSARYAATQGRSPDDFMPDIGLEEDFLRSTIAAESLKTD